MKQGVYSICRMYGNAAVYLRAKNVVPPSTDEQPQRGRGAGSAGRGGQ